MGVLHHAEALSCVAETFDHHTAGGATEDHFTAQPAGRVAGVAALVLLAAVSGVQAQSRQPRPSRAPQGCPCPRHVPAARVLGRPDFAALLLLRHVFGTCLRGRAAWG